MTIRGVGKGGGAEILELPWALRIGFPPEHCPYIKPRACYPRIPGHFRGWHLISPLPLHFKTPFFGFLAPFFGFHSHRLTNNVLNILTT